MTTALDLLPTIAGFAGTPLPGNPLDGVDIGPLLRAEVNTVDHPMFLYFSGCNLQCARLGRWKLHVARGNVPAFTAEPKVGYFNLRLMNPELYDIDSDPEEAEDASAQYPDIVKDMQQRIANMLPTLPIEVQTAWQNTQKTPVYPNVPGAYPAPIVQ